MAGEWKSECAQMNGDERSRCRYLEARKRVRLLPEVGEHDGHGSAPVADVTATEMSERVGERGR